MATPPSERGFWGDWKFSPDSQFLATSASQEISIWQLNPNKVPSDAILSIETEYAVSHLTYSHDGMLLAGRTSDGIIVIWNMSTGEELTRIETNTTLPQIEFSPDDALLLTEVADDGKSIWDIETGNLVSRLPRTALLNSNWSHATYWLYGTVQVVNIVDGGELELEPIEHYVGPTVAFHAMTEQAVFESNRFNGYNLHTGEISFGLPVKERQSVLWFNETGTYLFTHTVPIGYELAQTGLLEVWNVQETEQPFFALSVVERNVLLSPDSQY